MLPYVLLIILSSVSLFYIENYKKNIKCYRSCLKSYFVILGIIMILLGTLRSYDVGADTSTYLEYFNSDFYYKIEVGYIFINKFFYFLGANFRVVMLVLQVITVMPILFIIYRSSKMKWLSVFLYQGFYLYANSFNILRQSVAMVAVLISIYILNELTKGFRRNLLFLTFILLGTLFHTSAILFIIMLPLKDFNIKKNQIITAVILSLIISIFREPILSNVFIFLNRPYINTFDTQFGFSTIAILSLFLGIGLEGFQRKIIKDPTSNFVIKILIGALFFNIVWAWFPNHARITMYVYLILSVYFPSVIYEKQDSSNYKIILWLVIIVVFSLYIFQLGFRDYGQVVPYTLLFIY